MCTNTDRLGFYHRAQCWRYDTWQRGYFAFYTNNDELVWYWDEGPFGIPIVKFDNAELGPGATNIELGEMCPFRWVGHVGMIADPVPIEMTLDALAGNPISVPYLLCWLPPVVL